MAARPPVASQPSGRTALDRNLGHQIRDLRKAKGVTIQALAARIDRSVGWLSQIERGLSAVTISALHQIAASLEVQVSWFFGQSAAPPDDELGLVLRRRLQITGSTLRPRPVAFKAAIAQALRQRVWPLIAAGKIRPVIHSTFPAAHAAQAHALMESNEHVGKIVLTW